MATKRKKRTTTTKRKAAAPRRRMNSATPRRRASRRRRMNSAQGAVMENGVSMLKVGVGLVLAEMGKNAIARKITNPLIREGLTLGAGLALAHFGGKDARDVAIGVGASGVVGAIRKGAEKVGITMGTLNSAARNPNTRRVADAVRNGGNAFRLSGRQPNTLTGTTPATLVGTYNWDGDMEA